MTRTRTRRLTRTLLYLTAVALTAYGTTTWALGHPQGGLAILAGITLAVTAWITGPEHVSRRDRNAYEQRRRIPPTDWRTEQTVAEFMASVSAHRWDDQ